MALEGIPNGLVIASMHVRIEDFHAQLDSAKKTNNKPDGVLLGPALVHMLGVPDAANIVESYLGSSALIFVEHYVDGWGSDEVAQILNESLVVSGVHAVVLRAHRVEDARRHISSLKELDENVKVIVGPPRKKSFTASHSSQGYEEDTWIATIESPIELGVENFIIPGSLDSDVGLSVGDLKRIGTWTNLLSNNLGYGGFAVWFDRLLSEHGALDLMEATGGNTNTNFFVKQFGRHVLSDVIADTRSEIAHYSERHQ